MAFEDLTAHSKQDLAVSLATLICYDGEVELSVFLSNF